MADFMDDSYGGMGDYMTLMNLFDETEQEIDNLRESGYRIAKFQAEYRMRVAVMTLELRSSGTPVTIIPDVVRGDPDIAALKAKWVCAESDNKASNHIIFLNEKKIDVLNEQIKREWHRPSNA